MSSLCASVITLCQHICLLLQIIRKEIDAGSSPVVLPCTAFVSSIRSVIMPFYQTVVTPCGSSSVNFSLQDLCAAIILLQSMHLEMISSILICFRTTSFPMSEAAAGNPENLSAFISRQRHEIGICSPIYTVTVGTVFWDVVITTSNSEEIQL